MKWSLVLVFLFGILAVTTYKPPINWRRDFKTTRDCERQENVSSIDAYEAVFLKKNEPVDYKVKCFLHCAIEESVNFIQSFNLVPLRKVDNCRLIKDEDKCEEGLMKFKCYYKN